MRHIDPNVLFRRSEVADAESFLSLVNDVARETWGGDSPDRFKLAETRKFLARVVSESLPQIFAIRDDVVIGCCDIIPRTAPGATHVGYLGMAVQRAWRGQGLGRRLLDDCLALSRCAGIEKVELEVVSDNAAAIALYRSVGFANEGLKRRALKVRESYQDLHLMALWL